MALIGDIRVNNQRIGFWEAVRKDEIAPGRYRYRTRVELNGDIMIGTVDHNYADGAAILASKVLSHYGLTHSMLRRSLDSED